MSNITRRQALARIGAFMAAGGIGLNSSRGETSATASPKTALVPSANPDGSFSIAHITDVHITDEMNSEKWVAECFHKIQSHQAKPQLILNTGDSIMDSIRQTRERSEQYWKVWNNAIKRDVSLPIHSVLGNHDMWGIRMPNGDPVYKDPMFGKKLGQERLGIEKLYYSVDHGKWHFVMLDSVMPIDAEERGDWIGKLDDEQFAWLEQDLENVPKDHFICVNSHVPILQIVFMRNSLPTEDGKYETSPKNTMVDARRIIDLFAKHPNVKLCFSGHTHSRDFVTLGETTYINAGAVCGGKWRDEMNPKGPGYSIATLHPDGTFDYNYEGYGWKPSPALS